MEPRSARLLPLLVVVAALLVAPARPAPGAAPGPRSPYSAEIRRTAHGIPHIKAGDYGSLGFGYGYGFAEDNVCTARSGPSFPGSLTPADEAREQYDDRRR
jgi:acyl-homoserine-lactone acylase